MSGGAGGKVLELVVYKLKDGVTRQQFLATNDAVSEWVKKQPGFISRDLSYSAEHDQWIDVLYWRSMSEAKAAAREAESSTDCAPLFALIDMENNYVYVHGEPAASQVLA